MKEVICRGAVRFFVDSAKGVDNALAGTKQIGDWIAYSCGVSYPPCNGVMAINNNVEILGHHIQEACHFFQEKGLPFLWWHDAPILKEYGFQFAGELMGVGLKMHNQLPDLPPPEGIVIQEIKGEGDLQGFQEVHRRGFDLDHPTSEQVKEVIRGTQRQGGQLHFLAKKHDEPVATLTLSLRDKTAGIWNVTTKEEYRYQGISAAMLSHALLIAQKQKAQYAIAILMPKGLAGKLFEKFGFENVIPFPFYLYGADINELEK